MPKLTVDIRKPFYGAGSEKQYNWVKDGYHIWGIGIKLKDLEKNSSIYVTLNRNKLYELNTAPALEFIKKYNSYYKVRNYDIILGVFSLSIMKNITTREENKNVQKLKDINEPPTSVQTQLL